MQNSQPENNSISKIFSQYDSKPKENFNESLFYVTAWVLPTSMDES